MKVSLQGLIFEILKEAGHPKNLEELCAALEERLKGEGVEVTRSSVGSLLSSSGLFMDYGDDLWGLTAWGIKDAVFRVHPTGREIDSGTIKVDHELILFFPRDRRCDLSLVMRDPTHGEFPCVIKANSRRLEGLGGWYSTAGFVEGDDAIIKVVDGVGGIYEIRREPQGEKDLAAVALLNRRMADLAYEVFPDGSPVLLSSVMWEIIRRMPMTGSTPPDRLVRVLEGDPRFTRDSEYGLFMLSAPKSALMSLLADTNRMRSIIDRHRDPDRALRELFGGEPEFADKAEGKRFMEQFIAMWNMLKAGPGMSRR